MKPYGSYNRKSRQWTIFEDKIPKRFRRYFNKATRALFRKLKNSQS